MTKSIAQHLDESQRYPAILRQSMRDGNRKVAVEMTAAGRRHTAIAAPRMRLNVGRKGRKVGVRFDEINVAKGTYRVRATGPYQLIERDTSPHREPRATRRRKGILYIPGIGFRAWVNHPGTRGKHPFEATVNDFTRRAPQIWQDAANRSLKKNFG